jgi:dTDP-4-amino-4,6-dideoxygalactose transaminase
MQALTAEGVLGVSTYPQPVYRNRLFADFPFRKLPCAAAEAICEECFWLSHEVLLADWGGVEDVIRAFEKIAKNRLVLGEAAMQSNLNA